MAISISIYKMRLWFSNYPKAIGQCQISLKSDQVMISMCYAEMPTSTFLPYFVRFLKENTAVRFFPPKYVFFFFYSFFFFFFLYWRVKALHYTHYLCYENLVRVFE